MIRLRFYSERTFQSKVVKWWTKSKWSHVELVMPTGYIGARLDGGVQLRPFDYAKLVDAEAFATIECTQAQTASIENQARLQCGKKYDWLSIVGIVFGLNIGFDNRWICSELIAWLVRQAGIIFLGNKELDLISPANVAHDPKTIFDDPKEKS